VGWRFFCSHQLVLRKRAGCGRTAHANTAICPRMPSIRTRARIKPCAHQQRINHSRSKGRKTGFGGVLFIYFPYFSKAKRAHRITLPRQAYERGARRNRSQPCSYQLPMPSIRSSSKPPRVRCRLVTSSSHSHDCANGFGPNERRMRDAFCRVYVAGVWR
jgi:hypothetical protein